MFAYPLETRNSILTGQWDGRFVLRLVAPLQYTNVCVQWEWLGRVFQSNLVLIAEQLLVHVRVCLQLYTTLIGVV